MIDHDECIKNFIENVRKVSRLRNIGLLDLATLCNLTDRYFYNYGYHHKSANLHSLISVANAFHVDLQWLFTEHSDQEVLNDIKLFSQSVD